MRPRMQSIILAIGKIEFVYPENTAILRIMIDHIIPCIVRMGVRQQVDLELLWEIFCKSCGSRFHIVDTALQSIQILKLCDIDICHISPSVDRLDVVWLPFRLHITIPP